VASFALGFFANPPLHNINYVSSRWSIICDQEILKKVKKVGKSEQSYNNGQRATNVEHVIGMVQHAVFSTHAIGVTLSAWVHKCGSLNARVNISGDYAHRLNTY